MIVGFKRLECEQCQKLRLHETMFGLAKCVICHSQRQDDIVLVGPVSDWIER